MNVAEFKRMAKGRKLLAFIGERQIPVEITLAAALEAIQAAADKVQPLVLRVRDNTGGSLWLTEDTGEEVVL